MKSDYTCDGDTRENFLVKRRYFQTHFYASPDDHQFATAVGTTIKVETVALDVAILTPESRAALRAALLEMKSKG